MNYRIVSVTLVACLTAAVASCGGPPVSAQGAAPVARDIPAQTAPTPEGYVPRGTRPEPNLAPGMRVTDLGRSARTYRINLTKGDEILSGLTEFAEKYKIRNAHFTALGAIDKALFGWTDIGRAADGQNLQKKIELNEEAEIVSLIGSITMNAQGQAVVHAHGAVALSDGTIKGGHWWQARVSIIAQIFVTEEEAASQSTP